MIKMLPVFLLATSLIISHLAHAEEDTVTQTAPPVETTAPAAPADHREAVKSMLPYIQENDSIRKEAAKKYGPAKSKKSKKKKSKKKKVS